MAKLKDTPFSSGAKDALATVDVYKENSKTAINKRNKVADKVNKVNDKKDLIDKLINDKRYQSKLISKLLGGKLSNLLSGNKGLSMLARFLNKDKNLLTDLLPLNLAVLLKLYQKKKKRKVKINNSYRYVSDAQLENYNNANDLYSSIVLKNIELKDRQTAIDNGDITTSPNTVTLDDLHSESVIYSTIIGSYLELKDTASILKVLNEIIDPQLKQLVMELILPLVITNVDLDILDLLIDGLGLNKVLGMFPNIVEDILGNFKLPIGTKPAEWGAYRTKLENLSIKINPNWYLIDRAGTPVRNYRPFMRMSTDTINLFMGIPLHKVSCMIADTYKETSILDLLRKQYPLSVF